MINRTAYDHERKILKRFSTPLNKILYLTMSNRAKLLYWYLVAKNPRHNVSRKTMGKQLGWDHRSLRNALKELFAWGIVKWSRKNRRVSYNYEIVKPSLWHYPGGDKPVFDQTNFKNASAPPVTDIEEESGCYYDDADDYEPIKRKVLPPKAGMERRYADE